MRKAIVAAAVALAGGVPASSARAAQSSLYSGPGPRPGPAILYQAPATAPQLTKRRTMEGTADPRLRRDRLSRRRVPLPGLPVRRSRRARGARPDRSAASSERPFSKPNGTYTYPTGARVRQRRRRPGRVPDQAARGRHRVPRDPEHAREPLADRLLDRDRRRARNCFPVPRRGERERAREPVPHRPSVRLQACRRPRPRRQQRSRERPRAVRLGRPQAPPDRGRRPPPGLEPRPEHRPPCDGRRPVGCRPAAGICCRRRSPTPRTRAAPARRPTRRHSSTSRSGPPSRCRRSPTASRRSPTPPGGATAIRARRSPPATSRSSSRTSASPSSRAASPTTRACPRPVRSTGSWPATSSPPRAPTSPANAGSAARPTRRRACLSTRAGSQPYAIYVPKTAAPAAGYGLTLLLHSLSANYNQYTGSRNQSQFANRATPSIVITPEARGPDQFYEGLGAADVFEVWADVARSYHLDPSYTEITGYSMGGIGTFKLGAQFPDLFARAQPTVGDESNNDVLASLRNVPVLMWNNSADELVDPALYGQTADEAPEPRLSLRARRVRAVPRRPERLGMLAAVPRPPRAGGQRSVRARGGVPRNGPRRLQPCACHVCR